MPSLLELTQGLIERTYGMSRVVHDVGRYVIGDHGYRRLYAGVPQVTVPTHAETTEAKTLVRETDQGLRVCVYYPNALIRSLEGLRGMPTPRRGETRSKVFFAQGLPPVRLDSCPRPGSSRPRRRVPPRSAARSGGRFPAQHERKEQP